MNAVTAMRFKTGASTHPFDLKLNCGGRIFPSYLPATMVPSPRRLPHTISPLEGDGFEPSVPRQIFSAARTCAIDPRALRQAEQWINARRIEWERRLDGLGEYLKTLETKGDCDGSGD